MGLIGSPIETSLLQAAQAQQTASKARDKERASNDRSRRFEDQVELRVSGVEDDEAVRALPKNESEVAEDEHRATSFPKVKHGDDDEAPRVDLTA
ncbi:MAG: hypothetical protein ACYTGR_00545 [Planctomycetota bacterium]|jgi:hypothetical protein